MALEVWVGTEVTVAKLQKVIDRASTELLDVRGLGEFASYTRFEVGDFVLEVSLG